MSTTTTIPPKAKTSEAKYLTASCQQIVEEDFASNFEARVLIRTCLADPKIWPAIGEHHCHEVALTPSGLYADMAAVVAEYIWKAYRGRDAETPGLRVGDMEVNKTYIISEPQPSEGQWLEMEALLSVPEYTSGDMIDGTVKCYFRSIRPNGVKLNDLAFCTAQYEFWHGWLSSWSHNNGLIRTKIANLHSRARTEASGEVQQMHRKKAYEVFKSFVDYGPRYQNMAEVTIDTKTLEATARLDLQPDPQQDYTGPYYLDASCHVSGFVCNTAEEDTTKNAYISHGIDTMRISPKFQPYPGANIQNYVHMQPLPSDKTVLSGDVYILQDDEIVGVWEGVRFKRIPRRILNVFLPKPKKS